LIEEGIGEGRFGDGAYFPGNAEADLMNGLEGLVVQDRLLGAGQLQVMGHIAFGFLRWETGQVVADGDPLLEGLHDGKVHNPSQIGLTGEDEDEGVIGIHFEVGQEPQLFQGAGLEEMGLIDDQEDGFSGLLFGVQEGFLDLEVDGAFGKPGGQAEEPIDMIQKIGPAEGGQGGVKGFKEIFIEVIDEVAQGRVRNREKENLKTEGSRRGIEIRHSIRRILEAQKELTARFNSPYIFLNTRGRPILQDKLREFWMGVMKKSGVPYRRMYETRHTFASWALAAGESPEWVARTLGQVNTSMVYSTYGRYIPNLTRKDGSAFEAQFGNTKSDN